MTPSPILDVTPSWLQPAPYQSPAQPYPQPQVVPTLRQHPMDVLLANCLITTPRPE